jgi:hypothetical protein
MLTSSSLTVPGKSEICILWHNLGENKSGGVKAEDLEGKSLVSLAQYSVLASSRPGTLLLPGDSKVAISIMESVFHWEWQPAVL